MAKRRLFHPTQPCTDRTFFFFSKKLNASVKFGKHNVINEIDKKMNKMNKIVRIVLYSVWLV